MGEDRAVRGEANLIGEGRGAAGTNGGEAHVGKLDDGDVAFLAEAGDGKAGEPEDFLNFGQAVRFFDEGIGEGVGIVGALDGFA